MCQILFSDKNKKDIVSLWLRLILFCLQHTDGYNCVFPFFIFRPDLLLLDGKFEILFIQKTCQISIIL